MSEVESLTLEMLRRIDRRLDNIEGDVHDLKLRMSTVEDHLGTIIVSIGGLNHRMDRFDERFSRVERRLDLSDVK
jgi:hypothetical protein